MQREEEAVRFLHDLARAERATERDAWNEAIDAWTRVVATNPVVGRYWHRLAEAMCRNQDFRGAIGAFDHALALRHGCPAETAYRIACCHALLDEPEEALSWLERSWALGFRHLDRARSDEDLVSLRANPRFRDLVADVDT